MKKIMTLLLVMMVWALAACAAQSESNRVAVGELAAESAAAAGTAVTQLAADDGEALSVMAQLAVGTLQLEGTDLAVDETLAAELLPLWQMLQTLSRSDTAADVEIQAVVNQIQETMTPAQLAAVADMQLTNAGLMALIASGEWGMAAGRGGFAGGANNGQANGGFPGGGPPGGGAPGGGAPGGGGVPGGPGGPGFGGGGTLSEDDLATRQARFAPNGAEGFQDRLVMGAVVRLLESKLGIVPAAEVRQTVMNEAFTAVAEAAGLTVAELQAQVAEGQTMAGIVAANGGDVAALQVTLQAIFGRLPDVGEEDMAQAVNDWLGGVP